MEIAGLVLILIPALIAVYAIYKVVRFFMKSQPEFLYEAVQDNTGNAEKTN